ncbi:MAG: tRNA 2-thiouridine(34) synthase MnmA [Verrucomicrobia bacterium]|nr:tRNA 2-thiouridine(34) synthase MnmA [Verrucomicrobiota bacterium]
MGKKVVIAMSGGVDSSVCAAMMHHEGYDCIGMTMRLYKGKEAESCSDKSCCGDESVEDARLVCETLGIPFFAINFREEFWEGVVQVFAREYYAGRTPSPCILCNEKLKFDSLYKKAIEVGAEKVCTGHYAQIHFNETDQRWNLLRGVDPLKDQSYFLFSMTQEQLAKTLFPLGDRTKTEIRAIAGKEQLVTANKPESQDICFIPDGNYARFIEKHFPHLKGEKGVVRHVDGQHLGEHEGIHTVTIGQRKGLKIAFGEPLYVTKIDSETGEVQVGPKEALERLEFKVERVNWIAKDPDIGESFELHVRLRSRGPEALATVTRCDHNSAHIRFKTPQRAITPGQAAVFYKENFVFGGGWII